MSDSKVLEIDFYYKLIEESFFEEGCLIARFAHSAHTLIVLKADYVLHQRYGPDRLKNDFFQKKEKIFGYRIIRILYEEELFIGCHFWRLELLYPKHILKLIFIFFKMCASRERGANGLCSGFRELIDKFSEAK